ncbi:ATP synthase F0 subunit B [Blautia schinkii]|nr:ATP synthase F0 subunit B [Blautia schinkii]
MLTLNWNIIWTFVNLIVLFLLLKKFLFRPVKNIMAERENMLNRQLEDAREKEKVAAGKLKEAQSLLKNADEKARQKAAAILEEAEKRNNTLIVQAQEEADKILADSQKRADKEREKLLSDSRDEIAGIALSAAKRLAGAHISQQEERRLFEQLLSEAGGNNGE